MRQVGGRINHCHRPDIARVADPTVLEIAPRYRRLLSGLVGTIGGLPGSIAIQLIRWWVDTTGSYNRGFISAALLNVFDIVVWLALGTGRKVID